MTTGQSTDAAQRSAHVLRGPAQEAGQCPVVEVSAGVWKLRAVVEARQQALEEAARAVRDARYKCEFFPAGRSRGVPMLSPSSFKDQAAAAIRALGEAQR